MKPFTSISVTSYNRKELTEYCIKSIINNTPRENFELVVVDNQSTDGAIPMLEELYSEKLIDKFIINQQDSLLGTAINLAWEEANPKSEWLITFSNDHLVMDKWFDNFVIVSKDGDYHYVLCHLLMPGYTPDRRQIIETPSGGKRLLKGKAGKYIFGGGLALRKDIYDQYKIRFPEDGRKNSPFSVMCKQLFLLGLRGTELAKPCSLQQDSDWNNPAYKEYYERIYLGRKKRKGGRIAVLRGHQKDGYTPYVKEYYEGTNYLDEKNHQD